MEKKSDEALEYNYWASKLESQLYYDDIEYRDAIAAGLEGKIDSDEYLLHLYSRTNPTRH